MTVDPSNALASLGFTGLESEIYAFLLSESPATGYRVAQAIGKQVANVYKAIQTLEAKGAVTVDSEASRQCRPVPVDDLLGRIAREFEERKAAAHATLTALGTKKDPERVFALSTLDLVIQQARALITDAKQIIALSSTGALVDQLAAELQAALGRSVVVHLQADHDVAGIPSTKSSGQPWPGESLVLCVDGSASLLAFIDRWGNVVQAFWSRGAFLALVLHDGLVNSALVADVRERIEEGAGPKRITRALSSAETASSTLGFQILQDELL